MLDAEESRRPGFLTAPFLVVCTFYFLVFAAGYQLFPVVPLHLRDLGASLAGSGRFQTAFMLGSGFGALFTGPLGARLGPRRVLRVATLAVSVKSNFGHIEAGAGLLGVAKAALSLQHEEIFPSIHFNQLNPNIDLGHAPVRVATQRIPWERNGSPRLVGVNSFGYSGTNAHVILQEAPISSNGHAPKQRGVFAKAGELIIVSAKSQLSLDGLVERWIELLDKDTVTPLHNIAFTAAMGRTQLTHRLAVSGKDKDEIKQRLQAWRDGRAPKGLASGQVNAKIKPKIAFVFTGQGSQYAGMGRELFDSEPRFTETNKRVASIMDPELGAEFQQRFNFFITTFFTEKTENIISVKFTP